LALRQSRVLEAAYTFLDFDLNYFPIEVRNPNFGSTQFQLAQPLKYGGSVSMHILNVTARHHPEKLAGAFQNPRRTRILHLPQL
jgi:hypothetical protein